MADFSLDHHYGSVARWRFCRLRQLLDSLHPSLLLMQTRQEGYAADEFFLPQPLVFLCDKSKYRTST